MNEQDSKGERRLQMVNYKIRTQKFGKIKGKINEENRTKRIICKKIRVKRRKRKNREMKGGWQSNYFISEKGIEEKKDQRRRIAGKLRKENQSRRRRRGD